jgi:short-subunit dehydrogenase
LSADLKSRFGPVALITGASDGIGRAFSEELAGLGFDLILVARRDAVLHDLARDLMARHRVAVEVIAADLATPQGMAKLIAATEKHQIGLLVASAGFGGLGAFVEADRADVLNMVDLNCRSVVELTHAVSAQMARNRKGGIVLFGSIVGFQGVPGQATYAATKGFVQSFAEGLRAELRPLGVTVLSVAPGPVDSGFAARAGMRLPNAERPEVIARGALAALPRGGTVRPGFLSKLLGWSLSLLPRWGRVMLLAQITRGMRPR